MTRTALPRLTRRFASTSAHSALDASGDRRRIVSGIQPTGGVPHIGNYLGAIKNWVSLQDRQHSSLLSPSPSPSPSSSVLYMIVDLHAITVPQQPKQLRQNILDMTVSLLACGIHPSKSIVFQQSQVSGHAELMWILGCVTPTAWLSRMTQWKSKKDLVQSGALGGKPDWGLFSYPILMAADVLLYKATHVPVGDDQQQHLELTNHIGKAFNHSFGAPAFFPLAQPLFNEGARIMSLRNPASKMSKSDASDKSRINLTDTNEDIRTKIQKALTDSFDPKSITYDVAQRPGLANLLAISAILQNKPVPAIVDECQRDGTTVQILKEQVAELLVQEITPIREKVKDLSGDLKYVQSVLDEGSAKANDIARETLREVRKVVGFDP